MLADKTYISHNLVIHKPSIAVLKPFRKNVENKYGNEAMRIGEKDCERIGLRKKREEATVAFTASTAGILLGFLFFF